MHPYSGDYFIYSPLSPIPQFPNSPLPQFPNSHTPHPTPYTLHPTSQFISR
ncbi:hypothetical protein MYAER_3200 [Microcystis aeruginosa NIES-2549]|uniref:Uncharacterized protein n=1 Tax=Microcystis aeruginosa NIES-2549 TaxID=1641812 RepID=A0A0F6RMS9_MICAE|nr:hypothetical protein MYAER_3200 [Microcystis aeruginosa NIES-2549]AOC53952.1 hypothetical protein amyaer_3247 [Microcystis aeruginosa NIES-2481]